MFEFREVAAPYPGLRPFEPHESAIFFGREGHAERLLEILQRERLLAVIGPSGCGKSSLVRAGLLPGLATGALGTGSNWRAAILRPGDRPMLALAQALLGAHALGRELVGQERIPKDPEDFTPDIALAAAELRRGTRGLVNLVHTARGNQPADSAPFNLLVLVDQFEEIFTYARSGGAEADESDAFINLLLAARDDVQSRIHVVLTMRTDFLGNCVRFLDLPDAINRAPYLTPRLTREQMERAIVGPARVFGGDVEPGLAAELINNVGQDSDQLPILQHALARMWREAERANPTAPQIGWAAAKVVGGVGQALDRHAEEVLQALSSDEKTLAEALFRAITERRLGEGGGQDVRRPQTLAAIAAWAAVDANTLKPVIRAYAAPQVSFLQHGRDLGEKSVIDLTHEALIRQWATLKGWVEDEYQRGSAYRHWSQRAAEYTGGKSNLLSGADLARALEWWDPAAAAPVWQPSARWAQRYSDLKPDEVAGELERTSKFIIDSRDEAERQQEQERRRLEELADAQRQRAEEAEARQRAEEARAVEAEHSAQKQRRSAVILSIVAVLAIALGLFAGLQWFKAGQAARRSLARQLAAQALVSRERQPELALLLAAQGVHLEKAPDTRSALLNVLQRHPFVVPTLRSPWAPVQDLSFGGDGAFLTASGADGQSATWNLATRVAVPPSADRAAPSLTATPGGRLAAMVRDSKLVVSDSATRQTRTFPDGPEKVVVAALAPDGATVAAGHADGSIVLRDVETRSAIGEPLLAHDQSVTALAFSRDGATLASGDEGGSIFLWPVEIEAWKTRACRMAGQPLTPSEDTLSPEKLYEGRYREVERFLGSEPIEPACRPLRDTPETQAIAVSEADAAPTVPADMVPVPAGWFWMGCNPDVDKECFADEAGHRVYVETFAIDRTEVTVADYKQCVEDRGACDEPDTGRFCNWGDEERDEHPLNCVDWFQASKYCQWKGKRLPREAEWEKAARGREGWKYPWGNDEFGAESKPWANIADETAKRELGSVIPYFAEGYDDGFETTAPVGSFPDGASPYKAFDMAGNVYEWVWDRTPGGRGLRGGSWGGNARLARASGRSSGAPRARSSGVGFRCAQ